MGRAVRPPRHGDLGKWPEKKKGKGRVVALVILGGLVTAVLAVMAREPAPPGTPTEAFPEVLVGRWVTADARYSDRHITISPGTVSVGLGGGVPPDEGSITSVRTWKEGQDEVYRLGYSTVDGDQVVEIILMGPDRMRLRNPSEVVWSRAR